MKYSKRVKSLKEKLDLKKEYSIEDAINLLKENSKVILDGFENFSKNDLLYISNHPAHFMSFFK